MNIIMLQTAQILSLIIVFITILLSLFILLNKHNQKVNVYFFSLGLSISLWVISNILADTISDHLTALFFTRIAIVWTALLPIFFNQLIWNLYFKDREGYKKMHNLILILSLLVTDLIIILSQTKLNIKDIYHYNWGVDTSPGMLYYILFFYLVLSFGFSFFKLFEVYSTSGKPHKSQAKLMMIGSLITVVLSIIMDIVLPISGYGFASIFAPSTTIFFLGFTFVAIFKYHLFNIKVILIEVATVGLWIFMLVRVVLSNNLHELLVEGGIFLIIVVLGILLIQTVLHNIKQREEIAELSNKLAESYHIPKTPQKTL